MDNIIKDVLFLEPVFKDYIWGGNRLKSEFGKNSPYDITAESWEIAANKNGNNVIKNGEYKGKTLKELFDYKDIRVELFGTKCKDMEKFPLLIKFIDAKNNLSVQVHPDDEYARKFENDSGKTEMWYILDCNPDSKIICGVSEDVKNKEQLKEVVEGGKIEEHLRFVNVKKGDCIYIPSGTVHAILKDVLICEIQQNCDLTYRVYDWNRVDKNGNPRELHVKKALDVINLDNRVDVIEDDTSIEVQRVISNKYFNVDRINVKDIFVGKVNSDSFVTIDVIDGDGKVKVGDKEYDIKLGDSFIVPACSEEYCLSGNMKVLVSYI